MTTTTTTTTPTTPDDVGARVFTPCADGLPRDLGAGEAGKLPDGWFGKAPKSEYVQLPGTDAGVPEIPYAAPIAPVLVRGMALTLHAHHADDLLDMVLPDGWRDVIEEGRAA